MVLASLGRVNGSSSSSSTQSSQSASSLHSVTVIYTWHRYGSLFFNFKPGRLFRIPVNPNQIVDNVKVENKKGEDVESFEKEGKVKDECLHVTLSDQRVGPDKSEPVSDKKLHASTFSEVYNSTDSKEKAVELEACISQETKR